MQADPLSPMVVAKPVTEEKRAGKSSVGDADAQKQAPVTTDKGDDSAGLFRELKQCVYASRELATAKNLADCKFYEGKLQYEDAYARCLNGWMNSKNRIAAAESAVSECNQTDVESRYFEATKEAATKGDADAQLCYLQAAFGRPDGTSLFTNADIEEYKQVAPRYVDGALKRGDWRIAHLYSRFRGYPGMGPVALLDGIGQPETRYKMTKLLRLGATGPYAKGLDAELHDMTHPDLIPEAALPQDKVREGDAWAEQTYTDFFSGVPPGLTEAPIICSPGPGRVGSPLDLNNPDGQLSR
jgi:hypothetical protein